MSRTTSPADSVAPRRRWRKPVAAFGAVGTSAVIAVGLLGGAASASTTSSTASSRPALARPAGSMGGRFAPSGGAPSFHGSPLTGSRPAVVGTVKSVGTDSFTVESKSGTVYTVDVSSSTTYKDSSVSSASLSNVTTGETVAVVGTTSSDTVTATQVLIGTPPSAPSTTASTMAARPALGARPALNTSLKGRSGAPMGAPRGAAPLRR